MLLVEAGGSDQVSEVSEAAQYQKNLGSERDWAFQSEPNVGLNGRTLLLSMGKVLGGGSSINAMGWMHGHKSDWDSYAELTGDAGWSFDSIKKIFLEIEAWQGSPRRNVAPVACSGSNKLPQVILPKRFCKLPPLSASPFLTI